VVHFRRLAVFMIILCGFMVNPAAAQDRSTGKIVSLRPGYPYRGRMDVGRSESEDYRSFTVRVPDNAVMMRISLSECPVDLDLYANYEDPIRNYDRVDFTSETDSYVETIEVFREEKPVLQSGIYYIDVVYQLTRTPEIDGRFVSSVPFTINVELVTQRVDSVLKAGIPVDAVLEPESGMFRTYTFEVTDPEVPLRIDLYNATNDSDLYVRQGQQILYPRDADYIRDTPGGSETLVLGLDKAFPLVKGTYFINVYDRISRDIPEQFSLLLTRSAQPPEQLQVIPALEPGKTFFENAVLGTMMIICESGSGSGCVISPDGYLLTNYHVIRGYDGKPAQWVTAALSLNPANPPFEAYAAKVIAADEVRDLALLKITGTRLGKALPAGYRFIPFRYDLTRKAALGDSLFFLGYPSIGGFGSKPPITLTTGIVSGFTRSERGTLIKTDAEINSGNSGGAAFTPDGFLVGLPTWSVDEGAGQLAFLTPLSEVPAEWWTLVKTGWVP